MSSDELQSNALGVNGDPHVAAPDVTIKFYQSDLKIQGHKGALVAGSAFFSDHFHMHPASTKVTAPREIRPGVNISFKTVRAAIDYLHGTDIPEKSIAKNNISLLLVAKAFGIFSLEERVKKQLMQKLDREFEPVASELQILGLVDALRDFYRKLGGEVEIGNEVGGVVAATVGHACCGKIALLKKSPEFMALMKEVPVLAYDILASDVEVVPVVRNGGSSVEGEESGEGLNEIVEEVVTEEIVTEEVVTEVVEEVTTEIVEEVVEEVVEPMEE